MKVVVAIGGNALVKPDGTGDIAEQFAQSRVIARPLADLVQQGWQVCVTHGNGPQVGSIMRRVEIASGQVYPIDLGLAVADTQAGMGYMIAQTWRNELHHRGIERRCVAIITTVLVDRHDPSFENPTKPIGPFLDEATARKHQTNHGWNIVEDAGRGYRRVVPSPRPIRIAQMPTIMKLVEMGELIVAAGGGGIPIIENDNGEYNGVEAVIDKDRTSAILATEINADVLVLVTSIDAVYVNFGKSNQKPLHHVDVALVEQLIREDHFPPGSMLPKLEAAIQFLKSRNDPTVRAVITEIHDVPAALDGRAGTTLRL